MQQRIFLIKNCSLFHNNYRRIRTEWGYAFPNITCPSRQAISKLWLKFHETGNVNDKKRTGRPVSASTDDNKMELYSFLQAKPDTSIRRTSVEVGLSYYSIQIMLKGMKMKSYRPRLVQELKPVDFEQRRRFSLWIERICQGNNFQELDRILFTDEAQFKLNGVVNLHNATYWADENPRLIIERHMNSPGVVVWAGIWSGGIIGPYFFDGNVSGASYLEMIFNFVIPEICTRPELQPLRWHQDGAPAHFALEVRDLLDFLWPNEWIGRSGPVAWPPRSPDLTPMDFSVWGVIKDRVYGRAPNTVPEMKRMIEEEFFTLSQNVMSLQATCRSVRDRCRLCRREGGGHFQQFL